ncbi:MAG: hypothetical protein V7K40_33670 [Nostoc sp.]|uniref:hypothetical protein n=1 Tax=Nostoc sp. TaxID=1180 RepID=UPI002FF5D613
MEQSGWYLLTNLDSFDTAIKTFSCPSAIEAMFKDCKTAGYNLESTYTTGQRLMTIILLVALAKRLCRSFAYTCAVLIGRASTQVGLQKYLGRLQELKRSMRRHSAFWIGLYGCLSVGAMEFCQ